MSNDDWLLKALDKRLSREPDFAEELEFLLAGHRIYIDHTPERGKRFWVMDGGHLKPGEKNWLLIRGGDEYGNSTVALRISPKRYAVLSTNWTLRHTLMEEAPE